MTKRIVLFFAEGAQALDVTGPAAVFAGANTAVPGMPPYEIVAVSPKGGLVNTLSGLSLGSKAIDKIDPISVDTFLIAGHDRSATEALIENMPARSWVTDVAQTARRWGSVCSGVFALAAWDLLDGKAATTHWSAVGELSNRFPKIEVDPDSLFVTDGNIWTSAGVTAGIDMSLALVEADLGKDIATMIARGLVVYLRRPGHQSQFSAPLRQQYIATPKYSNLISWASIHLKERLTIDVLAERMGQSPRTFQRHFTKQFGQPPAMVIEDLRLDQAKALIAHDVPLQSVATEVGYSSATQLTSVFQRRYGVPPSMWKMLHS